MRKAKNQKNSCQKRSKHIITKKLKFEVIIIKFIKMASNSMAKLFINVKLFYYNFENFGITLIYLSFEIFLISLIHSTIRNCLTHK